MILECPKCHTRYLVPDVAIGAEGRTVRCANCRHAWFQDPPESDVAEAPPVTAALVPESAVSVTAPADTIDAPQSEIAAPPPLIVPAAIEPPASQLSSAAAFRPRINPTRRWTIAAFAAGLLMLIGVALIIWSGAPGLLQRLGIGSAEFPLKLVNNPIERRDLSNGSELFAISGKVINPSSTRQRVPDIRADLCDAQRRVVFSWTITPQQRTLGAKSGIDFNSAKLDVPPTSRELQLSFVGEDAANEKDRCEAH